MLQAPPAQGTGGQPPLLPFWGLLSLEGTPGRSPARQTQMLLMGKFISFYAATPLVGTSPKCTLVHSSVLTAGKGGNTQVSILSERTNKMPSIHTMEY